MAKELYENIKKNMTLEERAIEEKKEILFSDCWLKGKDIDTKYYIHLLLL